ncbi:benzoate/H(+) symporter BenE family transporter [Paracoccus sp. MC1862]|uniref:benzoate/H(+) symporter BenE family transporter n=1 Tax=Paracoccus sp. MC1862 TaxID=2760307 RepID=UPI00160015B5|nr:benzoate/H(+) symporter BenE family transporter [Paracoccus sp. MC1862]MBB1499560.1 benzoate/H(+) symporter BenE family transporter [Paracoccus sp. MC1862]QQO46097.1 benzoate/H(+) symporter BenE family transporter [Paracoccus sp. MC1862]
MSLRFRITGLFDRIVAAIPKPAAKGMMAGILFGFAPSAMGAIGTAPLIFAVLVVTCLVFSCCCRAMPWSSCWRSACCWPG